MKHLTLRIRFFLGQKWSETREGRGVVIRLLLFAAGTFGLLVGLGEIASGWQWLYYLAGPNSLMAEPCGRILHDLAAGVTLIAFVIFLAAWFIIAGYVVYGVFKLVTRGIPSLWCWLASNWQQAGERADDVLGLAPAGQRFAPRGMTKVETPAKNTKIVLRNNRRLLRRRR